MFLNQNTLGIKLIVILISSIIKVSYVKTFVLFLSKSYFMHNLLLSQVRLFDETNGCFLLGFFSPSFFINSTFLLFALIMIPKRGSRGQSATMCSTCEWDSVNVLWIYQGALKHIILTLLWCEHWGVSVICVLFFSSEAPSLLSGARLDCNLNRYRVFCC